ncbi:MBL fold metallo-hydrolase [Bacillus sp. B15-48]|uniref:MBL fold metallo-hydrolase n=1 Tax=Bacillus sp. B15-48 TaxID=1548601 RepID=UPI00193F324E|nr:MBL fold metallo-hydrolase [Bacillus sp. B15-48]MBM4764893.1 MBL fold metallo-hydrolase [Bacillus sp. B15-48]
MFNENNIEVFPVIVPTSNELKSFNFYLVKHNHSLTLIDAGVNTAKCWDALQKTLKGHGFTLTDITEVLLTHHHTDHIGLINRILSVHSIPVYAHPNATLILKRDREYRKMRRAFFKKLYAEMGCGEIGERQVASTHNPINLNEDKKTNGEIREMATGPFLGFSLLEIPGHAPDQVGFYQKECKWVFSGDLLIEHMPSNAFIEPDYEGIRTNSVIQQKQSLEKCLSLDVDYVFPGHGIIIENPRDLIKIRLKEIDEKADKYLRIIKSKRSIPSEIAKVRFGKQRYEQQFFNVMSEVIGYLDYLELNGEISKEKKGGIWQYY